MFESKLKMQMTFNLDYIDLSGNYRAITLEVDNENEAVDCLRNAWNANLLWHYNLNLRHVEPICRTRQMPWSADLLKKVLALPRILLQIQKFEVAFKHSQNKVIDHYSCVDNCDYHALKTLSETHSQINALKTVYENHIEDLKSKGVNPPQNATSEILKIIEYVSCAASSLENLKKPQGNDSYAHSMGYLIKTSTVEFLNKLPRVEGIFSSNGRDGFFGEKSEIELSDIQRSIAASRIIDI